LALVLRPDLDDERQQNVLTRYRQVIEKHGGTALETNAWGKRRLAYEINDLSEGFYFFVPFTADATANAELDRLLRIDDTVLRYLVVVRPRPNPPKPASLPEAAGAHGEGGPRTGPTPSGDRSGLGLPEPRKRPAADESAPAPSSEDAEDEAPATPAETAAAPAEEPEAPATPAETAAASAEEPEAPAADAEPTQE
jgi:small subunit ribosomal protein S6